MRINTNTHKVHQILETDAVQPPQQIMHLKIQIQLIRLIVHEGSFVRRRLLFAGSIEVLPAMNVLLS